MCIFCDLAKEHGTAVHDDDKCFAIPDKYPSEYGHLLVISKDHVESLLPASDEMVSHMFIVSKSIAQLLKERLGATGVNVATNIGRDAGQMIDHFHIHVIPKGVDAPGFMRHKELSSADYESLVARLKRPG